MFYEVVVRVV